MIPKLSVLVSLMPSPVLFVWKLKELAITKPREVRWTSESLSLDLFWNSVQFTTKMYPLGRKFSWKASMTYILTRVTQSSFDIHTCMHFSFGDSIFFFEWIHSLNYQLKTKIRSFFPWSIQRITPLIAPLRFHPLIYIDSQSVFLLLNLLKWGFDVIIRPVLQLSGLGELCFIIEVTLCDKLTFHFNGNWVGRERQKFRSKCLWSLPIWICENF